METDNIAREPHVRPEAIERREAIRRALGSCVGALLGGTLLEACAPPAPPPPCEPSHDDPAVGWGVSVLAPVFYGYADYDQSLGAPNLLRVYYPSLDGAPYCAPFLAGPGRFPLVIFLHGDCDEAHHYTKWSRLPETLARSGFVVAVPDLAGISGPWDLTNPTYTRIQSTLAWMRSSWSHRAFLMEPPTLGIVGHSWGALHGAQLALSISPTAYVSLSGGWSEWPSIPPRPLDSVTAPKLLVWGTASSITEAQAVLPDTMWSKLVSPKHRLVFTGGDHWDYVPPPATSCDSETGPCGLVDDLTADFVAVFLSKYMPPERSGFPRDFIPDDLTPPVVNLTYQQQFFVGGHLTSFGLAGSRAGCGVTLTWMTPGTIGTRTIP